jgi:hypothetical protein
VDDLFEVLGSACDGVCTSISVVGKECRKNPLFGLGLVLFAAIICCSAYLLYADYVKRAVAAQPVAPLVVTQQPAPAVPVAIQPVKPVPPPNAHPYRDDAFSAGKKLWNKFSNLPR